MRINLLGGLRHVRDLAPNDNLNNILTAGSYTAYSQMHPSNMPSFIPSTSTASILVIENGTELIQRALSLTGESGFRINHNGTWYGWFQK